jgi:hypothetical protein
MVTEMKKLLINLVMICLIFGVSSGNAAILSGDNSNSYPIIDEDEMTIEEFRELAYNELSNIEDLKLRSQLLCNLDNTFSTLESISVTPDMSLSQAINIIESTYTSHEITTKPSFQPTPAVTFGPILFSSIDANFADDEGFILKDGRRLRVDFTPNDVTSNDSYVKIRGIGTNLNFPFNLPEWPVQRFDISILMFFGSATSSNSRIVVNGFCIYTIVLAEWHKH